MQHIYRQIVLTVVLALAASGILVDDAVAQEDRVIDVIIYNVQFLPGLAAAANKRKEPEYRAERIGEEMARYDIVALNETFEENARTIILDKLRDGWGGAFNVMISPKPENRFNGGVLIASRLPFLETNAYIYEHYSHPDDYGVRADGHAAKGVIHARIKRSADAPDDEYIDVFATHLEARADHLREKQYPELAAFIKEHSDPDRPMLLLGDLNTRGHGEYLTGSGSQYARMMKTLKDARPTILDVWPHLKPGEHGGTSEQESADIGRRIDYILLANPQDNGPRLEPTDIEVRLFQDPRVIALSDHNAVAGEFLWKEE